MSDWSSLPDLLLGKIFSYLPTTDKLFLSDVCPQWAAAVYRPEVWHSFVFSEDDHLSLQKYAYLVQSTDWNLFINTLVCQKYVPIIKHVGKYFKSVRLYYIGKNSGQIINCLAENCLSIKHLKIHRIHGHVNVVKNHQHVCKQAVYKLIKQNTGLICLDVTNLDTYDSTVTQQRDALPFGAGHSQSLQQLYFFQSFQNNNLSNLMYLVSLRELAIEPKVLSYSLLYHLAGQALTDLHIVALSKHVEYYNEAMQDWHWKQVCSQNPKFRVHCHFGVGHEWTEREIMLKKEMPVQSFKYKKDYLLHYETLSPLLMNYSATLKVFVDLSFSTKVYEFARTDSKFLAINVHLLNFVRACYKLKVLMVKEVLLSSTILGMLACNKNLEIILMEDHFRFDTENALSTQRELTPPLSVDVLEVIRHGHKDEHSFNEAVMKLTGRNLKLLTKQEYFNLMLEQYIDFR